MDVTTKTIIILAGGTGGHVIPALAVARCLQEKGIHVHWIGTRQGIEARLVPQAGLPLSFIDIQGIRGKKISDWLFAPFRIGEALIQSAKILRKQKPSAILCMGGYVAGPAALMGFLMGCPILLHEQNSVAGTTNRILAHFAKKIMVAFPRVFANSAKATFTGNPIRSELIQFPTPSQRFVGSNNQPLKVLVVGGSQGAMALNQALPAAFALFAENQRPTIWHQCGKDKLAATQAQYANCGVTAKVTDYIEDMPSAYAFADVVICRAGALTISELAAVGVASILIPLPHAIDDHQTVNAKYLSDQNAAILLPQSAMTAQKVYELLKMLSDNPAQRLEMANNCRQLAKPHATQDVAQYCLGAMSE